MRRLKVDVRGLMAGVKRLLRWYGASPLHLLTMIGCFALAGYAAVMLLKVNALGVTIWFVGAVIGHDLILMPMYTIADRSVRAVFRHRPPRLPVVPWINYLRVPVVFSGILLLIWFPLILRLPRGFQYSTTLPVSPYLWHWLGVTGALFLISAAAYALRLRRALRRALKAAPPAKEKESPAPPAAPLGPESAPTAQ